MDYDNLYSRFASMVYLQFRKIWNSMLEENVTYNRHIIEHSYTHFVLFVFALF